MDKMGFGSFVHFYLKKINRMKNYTQEELLQRLSIGEPLVLVDFWAPWCNPCKQMAPELEKYAQSQANVEVCKIDIEANPEAAKKWGVRGIPTVVVFKGTEDLGRRTGVLNQGQIKALVDSCI
jgi:thioredoxin 1